MRKTLLTQFFLAFLCYSVSLSAQKNTLQYTAEEWAAQAAKAKEPHIKLQYYTQAWNKDKKNTNYLFALAEIKYKLGRFQEAIINLDSSLAHKPRGCEDSKLLNLRGRCYQKNGKPELAILDWTRCVKECPSYTAAHVLLADAYLDKKDLENTLKSAQAALKLEPSNDQALLIMAKYWVEKGDLSQAIASATQAINLNGVYKNEARYVRGAAYRKNKQLDLAIADLEQLPQNGDAQFALGEIYFQMGDYRKAQQAYQTAILRKPGFTEAIARNKEVNKLLNGKEEESAIVSNKGPKRTGAVFSALPPVKDRKPLLSLRYSGAALPTFADLSSDMPEVRSQGRQGSCVAFTLAYLAGFFEKKETQQRKVFSPAFLYNQKFLKGTGGMEIAVALELMKTKGICLEKDMPYNDRDSLAKPTPQLLRKATKYHINWYTPLYELVDLKSSLANGKPVVMGIGVDLSFGIYTGGIWNGPKTTASGHAMLVVGYDDSKKAIKVINSWSKDWGEQGYGWIAYSYIEDMIARSTPESPYINLFEVKDAQNVETYDDDEQDNTVVNNDPDQENNKKKEDAWEQFWKEFLDALAENQNNNNCYACDNYYYKYTDLHTDGVYHNQFVQNMKSMTMYGGFNIPQYSGYTGQIVVYFYYSNGNPVGSNNPAFSTYQGQAAVSTTQFSIPFTGLYDQDWSLFMPYDAFNIPNGGTTYMYGVPVLYIDNYGVSQGRPFDFNVTRW